MIDREKFLMNNKEYWEGITYERIWKQGVSK